MEELKYMSDYELHTSLGNEFVSWEKELKNKKEILNKTYKKKVSDKDPKSEEWKDKMSAKISAEDRRIKLLKKSYENIDLKLNDSLSVRRRVRIVVSQLTSKILKKDSNKFIYPDTLTKEEKDVLMNIIVKGLSLIEKENRIIEKEIGHSI
jgi:hypothetical protein